MKNMKLLIVPKPEQVLQRSLMNHQNLKNHPQIMWMIQPIKMNLRIQTTHPLEAVVVAEAAEAAEAEVVLALALARVLVEAAEALVVVLVVVLVVLVDLAAQAVEEARVVLVLPQHPTQALQELTIAFPIVSQIVLVLTKVPAITQALVMELILVVNKI
jgi:hypothetical protein